MWSAACGQAAEDLEFFVYRAVDVRRRWSWACLLVLFCRCVAPDHALCLDSVLSAYSLQASCVVFTVLWGPVGRSGGVGRVRIENSRRASGALAASRLVSSSSGAYGRRRSASGLLAALVCVQDPRGDYRPRHGAVFLVAMTLRSRRQSLRLQDLSQALAFRF